MTKQEQIADYRQQKSLAIRLGQWKLAKELEDRMFLLKSELSALPIEKEVGQ